MGAMLSGAVTADRNAEGDPVTADFAVNLDIPLPWRARVRAEFGRARWTFDGNHLMPTALPPEHVTLTRVSASYLLVPAAWRGAYAGGGLGVYRYGSEQSPMPRSTRPGLHALAGADVPLPGGALRLRLEGQIQAVGGPNASRPGTLQPLNRAPDGRSRVFSDVLYNLLLGIGIGWRF